MLLKFVTLKIPEGLVPVNLDKVTNNHGVNEVKIECLSKCIGSFIAFLL